MDVDQLPRYARRGETSNAPACDYFGRETERRVALEYIASRTDLVDDWIAASVALDRFRSDQMPASLGLLDRLGRRTRFKKHVQPHGLRHLHDAARILCRSLEGLAADHRFWADLYEGVVDAQRNAEPLEQLFGDYDELLAFELEVLKHVMGAADAYRLISEVGMVQRLRIDPEVLGVERLRAGSARLGDAACMSMGVIDDVARDGRAPRATGTLEDLLHDDAQPRRRRIVQALQATAKGVLFLAGGVLVVGNAGMAVGTVPIAAGGPPGWTVIAGSLVAGVGAMQTVLPD